VSDPSLPCTECGRPVSVPADATPGELVVCDHCGVELEVTSMDPLTVAIFEEEEK
jgi:alpha-aminoadipate/glutamate carrier protein LysW